MGLLSTVVFDDDVDIVDNDDDDCGKGKFGDNVCAIVAVTVSGASDKPIFICKMLIVTSNHGNHSNFTLIKWSNLSLDN